MSPSVNRSPQQSLIFPSLDCSLDKAEAIVEQTAQLDCIGGYKIGFRLGLAHGLQKTVTMIRRSTDKTIIYDHQKAATDIPDTAHHFVQVCADGGVNKLIFFPLTGPLVLERWVNEAAKADIGILVGGAMTHQGFFSNENGFITEGAAAEIYVQAVTLGVHEFVLPGTRYDLSMSLLRVIQNRREHLSHNTPLQIYSPGIGRQGGKWSDLRHTEGLCWHAFVGRSIVEATDPAQATQELFKDG